MKSLIPALAVLATLGAIAEPNGAPAPAAAEASAEAKPGEPKTDEVDLTQAGDAAEEATSLPVISSTVTSNNVTLVDIACENASLADVLRQFRKVTDANIISDDSTNLNCHVSAKLRQVPWLDGLQSILNTRGYELEQRGEIYFVRKQPEDPLLTRTFELNHASAVELADLFNASYAKKDTKGAVIHPIATCFEGANVVVVTATERVLADCEAIIRAVDKAIAQIYIEARFIEASTEAMHRLGVQWNSLSSWGATVHGLNAGMEYNNGRTARYANGSSTTATTGADGATAYTTVRDFLKPSEIGDAPGAGRVLDNGTGSMAWRNARGFSGQLSVDDFNLALSAFEQMNDVKVFSNPKIIVSNGKEAKVDMTTKFPNVRVQATRTTSNGSDSFDISTQLEVIPGEDQLMFAKEAFYSWGITLSVKPRISPDGLINVEIIPTISQLDSTSITAGTGFYKVSGGDSSAYSSYPVIEVKRLTTDFTMKDGATAVIGGLSKTTEEDVDSGIPYLRKLPWIGPKLFGWKSRGKVQKEIVVFVTIGIADPAELPEDVGLPKNAIVSRDYITGKRQEPGDRTGSTARPLTLDLRSIEEIAKDNASENGKVLIHPAEPAPAAEPAKPADGDTNLLSAAVQESGAAGK